MNLEKLYERHGESLLRDLAFKLGSAEAAEDVLQDAFCRVAPYDLRWRFIRNPRAIDWTSVALTEHRGESGTSYRRMVQLAGLRIRIVEYSPGCFADYAGAIRATLSIASKVVSSTNRRPENERS